jgi:hypothetical protein
MNEELSGDEGIVLLISLLLGFWMASAYYVSLTRVALLSYPRRQRLPLLLAPPIGLILLWLVLLRFAAKDVRSNNTYILLFMMLGTTWMMIACRLFSWLGISLREDALEQRNEAAIIAMTGAMLGVLLAYAGGNIGEGPTIYTTMFSSLLATGGLFVCWFLLETGSRISLAITLERDVASGWRLAGFLLSVGLILGRAVAGDWASTARTAEDFFRDGWVVLVLTLGAIFVERISQPTLSRPVPSVRSCGVLPACGYLLAACAVLIHLERWK